MWTVRIILLVLQRKKHRFECGGSDAAGPVRAADEADGPLRQALAQVQALDAATMMRSASASSQLPHAPYGRSSTAAT